jgi:hypothetical protein
MFRCDGETVTVTMTRVNASWIFPSFRRLKIPHFRRLKFPQVQKEDCTHAPAQQANAWMFRGRISIISFLSFSSSPGLPSGRSAIQPHPFQLVHFVLHVLPVVLSD